MKKLLLTAAIAATMTLTACSSAPAKGSYEAMIADAKAAHAQAAKAGNTWKQKKMKKPYVDHYIAKAEEAKKKGDEKGAMKWAKEALKSAEAELHQTNHYADLKPGWYK